MDTQFAFPIILLAAGQSRRMRGRDKLLEDVDGKPLLRHQADKAHAATSSRVLIALPPVPHPRYAALEGLDVTTVPVPDAAEGMNASLRQAFAALPEGTTQAMVLLADLPDLTVDDLKTVACAVQTHPHARVWRGATAQNAPGHPIVFDHTLFPAFADLEGDNGGKKVIAQAGDLVHLVALQGDRARKDLDTPEAWADWRRSSLRK